MSDERGLRGAERYRLLAPSLPGAQHGADENTPQEKAPAPPLRYAHHICEAMPPPWFVHADSGVFQEELISNFFPDTSEHQRKFTSEDENAKAARAPPNRTCVSATSHPAHTSTRRPAPSTQHPSPITQHPAPVTRHPAPITQHPSPRPWPSPGLVPGATLQLCGTNLALFFASSWPSWKKNSKKVCYLINIPRLDIIQGEDPLISYRGYYLPQSFICVLSRFPW